MASPRARYPGLRRPPVPALLAAGAVLLAGCLEHTVLPAMGPQGPEVARPALAADGLSLHGPANGGHGDPGAGPSLEADPAAERLSAPVGSDDVGLTLERPSAGTAADASSVFDYPRRPVEPDLLPLARFGLARHRVFAFRLPSSGDNRQAGRLVTGRYYEGREPGPRRLVIVLPIYGSSTYPPGKLARRLLAEDRSGATDVLLLDGRTRLFDWDAMAEAPTPEAFWDALDRSAEAFRTVGVDVRRLLDWAEARPGIDRERIGIVGFSIGALLASVVMGVDPRLDAGALVMGGGHLHDVFATCYGNPARVTRAVRSRFGWSDEGFRREMAAHLALIEPVRYAPAVDPARVLLVEAAADKCIPEPGRHALWAALSRPEKHTLGGSHRGSFLSMTFVGGNAITRRITEFLGEKL